MTTSRPPRPLPRALAALVGLSILALHPESATPLPNNQLNSVATASRALPETGSPKRRASCWSLIRPRRRSMARVQGGGAGAGMNGAMPWNRRRKQTVETQMPSRSGQVSHFG
jgi:hypothetical protein